MSFDKRNENTKSNTQVIVSVLDLKLLDRPLCALDFKKHLHDRQVQLDEMVACF